MSGKLPNATYLAKIFEKIMDEILKKCDKVIPHFPAYGVINPKNISNDILSTGITYEDVINTVKLLCADRYMAIEDERLDTYRLTSSGRKFIENKGYSGAERIREINLKSLETETSIRKRNERVTALSAVVAAIATSGYLLFEIMKFLFEHYFCLRK